MGHPALFGAILVLVFALAQGLFSAGVAATLVMGLGTAITVAALAGHRGVGEDLAQPPERRKGGRRHAVHARRGLRHSRIGGAARVGLLFGYSPPSG